MALIDDLRAAPAPAEILRHVARATWAKLHDGAECPPKRIPTPEDLAAWLPECPDAAREAAELFNDAWSTLREHGAARADNGALLFSILRFKVPLVMVTAAAVKLGIRSIRPDDADLLVMAMHLLWLDGCEYATLRHPLAPVVADWQASSPVPEPAVTDYDRPLILSRQFAHASRDAEPYYLTRFGTPAHRSGGQLLFGFEHPEMEGPTLPADIWTLALADAEQRGPGLPAALRIFLASIVHVPLHARRSPGPFMPPVMLMAPDGRPWTLRHFLGLIYARTGSLPRPNRYWDVLWGARQVLHSIEIPYEWNGRLWSRPVLRLDWPQSVTGGYDTAMLDEPWPVSVHLPPGDGTGAPVAWDRLRQYMTRDAAAARALINLAYRWHIEGKRLMPAPGKAHWLQRRDPKLYDRMTDTLAEQLCFPPGTGRKRRRDRIADAHAALERLVKDGAGVEVDGRLLPPVPRDRNRAERDRNRAPPPERTA